MGLKGNERSLVWQDTDVGNVTIRSVCELCVGIKD